MKGTARRRVIAAAALAMVVAAGLLVSTRLPDSAASDIAGDALYAAAAYSGLVVLLPRARSLVPAVAALVWCLSVEVLQLTGVPLALGREVPLLAFVLGTGFDPRDLLVYVVAVVSAAALDLSVRARVRAGRAQP